MCLLSIGLNAKNTTNLSKGDHLVRGVNCCRRISVVRTRVSLAMFVSHISWKTWVTGLFLSGALLGLSLLRFYPGSPKALHPIPLSDYEFTVEVNNKEWRTVLCPSVPLRPTFPAKLPPFKPSSEDKNIFFLETFCSPVISAKMACAVESAALHHPDQQIHLALTSLVVSATDPLMEALSLYANIEISTVDIDEVDPTKGELQQWLTSLQWTRDTTWAEINLSDALRLAVVCSFGGIYLDTDIISVALLSTPLPWIGREALKQLSNGAFGFPKDHWLCRRSSFELTQHYRGDVWGHNGPGVLQRSIIDACQVVEVENINRCEDVTFLDPPSFYSVPWPRWQELFVPEGGRKWIWDRTTLGIHLWNRFSKATPLVPGDGSVLDLVAQGHCPRVYGSVRKARSLQDRLHKPQKSALASASKQEKEKGS